SPTTCKNVSPSSQPMRRRRCRARPCPPPSTSSDAAISAKRAILSSVRGRPEGRLSGERNRMSPGEGSAPKMLWKVRTARLAHLALAVACLFGVTGSVGLHPEPDGASNVILTTASGTWKTPQPPPGPSHGCLACLAHRSIPLARLSGVVLQPGACVGTIAPLPQPHQPTFEPALHEGRAPPASS